MSTPSTAELSNISAPRDEQITPDDLLGDEKVYAALSDRLRIFLESIDD